MSDFEVKDENFEKDVLQSDIPVFLDFHAPWCGPCQMMGPLVEKLAGEYKGKVKILKYDVQAKQKYAEKYGIQGIPAFKIFKDGEEVNNKVGAMSEDELRSFLDSAL
jgi:thioredoxin 1